MTSLKMDPILLIHRLILIPPQGMVSIVDTDSSEFCCAVIHSVW